MKSAPSELSSTRVRRRLRPSLPLALLSAAYLLTGLRGQTNTTAVAGSVVLERGKTIVRQLFDGQSHEYSFDLQAGQYARVLVDQGTINVSVTLFAPNGKELFS